MNTILLLFTVLMGLALGENMIGANYRFATCMILIVTGSVISITLYNTIYEKIYNIKKSKNIDGSNN